MTDHDRDCLFCSIAAGEIPADIVHQDELVVAFRDVSPKAPTHVLLVTNVGSGAGQSVFHLHFHLLGGRTLSWPPG